MICGFLRTSLALATLVCGRGALGQSADSAVPITTAGIAYTGESAAIVSGGLARRAVFLQNVDATAAAYLDARPGWRGPHLFAYLLATHGADPSRFVGDAQVVSNIAANDGVSLYELFVEQSLYGYRASILLGLYDLNSEFDVTPAGDFFLNSSFGIGTEFGASGRNGPSIFPETSAAARIRVTPSTQTYAQFAVLDGVPGHPEDPRRTYVRLNPDEGALLVGEFGYRAASGPITDSRLHRRALTTRLDDPDSPLHFSAGLWHYTSTFETIGDSSRTRRGSTGLYLHADGAIPAGVLREPVRCFFRLGWADPRVNRFNGAVSGGCVLSDVLASLPDASLGIAVSTAFNSDRYRNTLASESLDRAETVIEAGLGIPVGAFVETHLGVQQVLNPDTDTSIPNATAIFLRAVLELSR